jgi:DNA-binding CsgD family transcriptional regulator
LFDQAEATLDAVSDATLPAHSQAQHHIWVARAALALAHSNPTAALGIADRLIASLGAAPADRPETGVVPRLWLLRGEALVSLGQLAAAEAALCAARDAADALGANPLRWRVRAALAGVYRSQRQRQAADREVAAAHAIVETLAANTPNDELRKIFLQHAHATIPSLREPTPRQIARNAFGGLTAREREIAALIAQGQSNRSIAVELILSERTVEKHVANIMAKLSVDTRTQIGVWAAEHGLAHP